jgi:hypothetical protein
MVEVNPGSVDAGQDTAPGHEVKQMGGGNFKMGQTQITENRSDSAFHYLRVDVIRNPYEYLWGRATQEIQVYKG